MPNNRRPDEPPAAEPKALSHPEHATTPQPTRPRRAPRLSWILLVLAIVGALAWFAWKKERATKGSSVGASSGRAAIGSFGVPVVPGVVQQKDVPIYLDGLGTV